jgi:hypothetical protein
MSNHVITQDVITQDVITQDVMSYEFKTNDAVQAQPAVDMPTSYGEEV